MITIRVGDVGDRCYYLDLFNETGSQIGRGQVDTEQLEAWTGKPVGAGAEFRVEVTDLVALPEEPLV